MDSGEPAAAPPALAAPAPWPSFAADEIAAATSVLASGRVNYWTGEEGRRLEAEYAAHTGVRHAVALANGTLALELALHALDLAPGDEVIVTPRSYYASAASVALLGLVPVFADVDRDSQNITPATIAAVLSPRTRALMPVHLAGWPCDMPGIMALAAQHGLAVIEDCAQAHGASIGGRRVGGFGQIGAFSFCQDKILTTGGEGGMVVTDDPALWRRAWEHKDHGKSWSAVYETSHPPGFRWLHEGLGSNWRLTEMQSAIGRVQLRKLEVWLEARARNAGIYAAALAGLDAVRVPRPGPGLRHAYYKFYAFVRPEALRTGWTRDRIMEQIVARGVPCFSGSCPEIYLEKAFVSRGLGPPARLPVARELGETSLMFVVHPTQEPAAVEAAAATVAAVIRRATR